MTSIVLMYKYWQQDHTELVDTQENFNVSRHFLYSVTRMPTQVCHRLGGSKPGPFGCRGVDHPVTLVTPLPWSPCHPGHPVTLLPWSPCQPVTLVTHDPACTERHVRVRLLLSPGLRQGSPLHRVVQALHSPQPLLEHGRGVFHIVVGRCPATIDLFEDWLISKKESHKYLAYNYIDSSTKDRKVRQTLH